MSRSGSVQSVERCLDLLEALAETSEIGVVELAARTNLQPSTAHRLLATLTERKYVLQSAENSRYLLGFKILELASALYKRTEHLRAIARPHLVAIQKITGESASLTTFVPPNVVYVDQVEGTQSVRMFAHLGAAVPAHTTASGKAIIAFRPEHDLVELFGPDPLPQLTPRTITSVRELSEELERICRRGYAIDNEEHEDGVSCVAVPIFDHEGGACAALSVSAPTQRIFAADPAELGELLLGRAAEISRSMGYMGTRTSAGSV